MTSLEQLTEFTKAKMEGYEPGQPNPRTIADDNAFAGLRYVQNKVSIDGETDLGQVNQYAGDKALMGEAPASDQVKYLHGNFGKGTYTFYGGHDPEDYQHFVGDPPTDLSLHRNSPGYRLILNNILFPAARKKEKKT